MGIAEGSPATTTSAGSDSRKRDRFTSNRSHFYRRMLAMSAGSDLPWSEFSSCVGSDPGAGPPSVRVGLRSSEHALGQDSSAACQGLHAQLERLHSV